MTLNGLVNILIAFLPAVILHEYAHGWVANKLGDPTAKNAGRLTLNPFKHIDPVGTIIFPGLLIFLKSLVVFGWAKPVPVDFKRLRNPRRDMPLVALAGPLTNILLAAILSRFLIADLTGQVYDLLVTAILINLVLAVFNMIPIPPLDGSRLVLSLLPLSAARYYSQLEIYGILIVFVLLSLGVLDHIIWPAVFYLAKLLGVS